MDINELIMDDCLLPTKENERIYDKYITLAPKQIAELKKMTDFVMSQTDQDKARIAGIQLATILNYIFNTEGV